MLSAVPVTAVSVDPALRRHFVMTLTDPSRLAILEELRGGELRVSDVVTRTGFSQPNVSKHLACLRGCGLVEREQRGREVFYSTVDGVDQVFEAIDALMTQVEEQVAGCELTASTVRARR
jgi:ArsR family transcriptional regulator, cadmium/lead-responsive transcriptional repressor